MWPSKPDKVDKQLSFLLPYFEAFRLMRKDREINMHSYSHVNDIFAFKNLLISMLNQSPHVYKEFMKFLRKNGLTKLNTWTGVRIKICTTLQV